MASLGALNSTAVSANCTISPNIILNDAGERCGRYIDALQTCPTASITPALRLTAANQTANCIQDYERSLYPGTRFNFTLEDPVVIKAGPKCDYPDFLPIMRTACRFDISTMSIPCSSTNATSVTTSGGQTATTSFKHGHDLEACQREAATQYVRCTMQKSPRDVKSCITQNAVKADWLPQIQTYTGAAKCKDTNIYLVVQAIHILRHVLSSLFSIVWWPILWAKMQSKFKFLQRKKSGKEGAAELNNFTKINSINNQQSGDFCRNPWTLETRYTLKATRLLQSIGREVLVAFITVLILGQTGFYGNQGDSFNEEISFYVIRPRPAPFLGLMGLYEPWSQKGLSELVVDGMLSFVAGTNVGMRYFGLVSHAPANPAAPAGDLKNLAVGAIMTSIPAFAVLAITFLWSMGMASNANDDNDQRRNKKDDGCGPFIAGLCIWTLQLCLIALFICILPLVALVEMVAQAIITIRRKRREKRGEVAPMDEENEWTRQKSRWEEPLTTTKSWFRMLYAVFLLSSFIINIGNWIFFANYLKLSGELYCPSGVPKITAVWILVPAGIDFLFWAFRSWTGDNWMGANGAEAPPI